LKAIVNYKYGSPDVLRLEEVPMPTPTDDEVLIKVYAVSVNRSDWEGLTGKPLYARVGGLFKPGHHILGSDIAGRVEAVGKNISDFQPGDEVFGETMRYCDGFAEYVAAPVKALARKPASMSFEEASAIPQAGVIALLGIREKGQVQPGQKVLINGAGGGTGSFAVQLAKLLGAEVTGVDNADKSDFVRSLGADHIIDYKRENFTKTGNAYDLILDLIAYRSPYAYARALRPNGTYYCVGGSAATLLQIFLLGPRIKRTSGKNVRVLMVQPNRKDLLAITELCEAGRVTPKIERIYPLSDVPEALRHLGEGRALGKLVITLENSRV
jgi:NADPH:quinone reductase-like Zn-dependent oxidoreductase